MVISGGHTLVRWLLGLALAGPPAARAPAVEPLALSLIHI